MSAVLSELTVTIKKADQRELRVLQRNASYRSHTNFKNHANCTFSTNYRNCTTTTPFYLKSIHSSTTSCSSSKRKRNAHDYRNYTIYGNSQKLKELQNSRNYTFYTNLNNYTLYKKYSTMWCLCQSANNKNGSAKFILQKLASERDERLR